MESSKKENWEFSSLISVYANMGLSANVNKNIFSILPIILAKAANFEVWEKIVKNQHKGQGFEYLNDPIKPGPTKSTEAEHDKQKSGLQLHNVPIRGGL